VFFTQVRPRHIQCDSLTLSNGITLTIGVTRRTLYAAPQRGLFTVHPANRTRSLTKFSLTLPAEARKAERVSDPSLFVSKNLCRFPAVGALHPRERGLATYHIARNDVKRFTRCVSHPRGIPRCGCYCCAPAAFPRGARENIAAAGHLCQQISLDSVRIPDHQIARARLPFL